MPTAAPRKMNQLISITAAGSVQALDQLST
jgi:hypothetical protein